MIIETLTSLTIQKVFKTSQNIYIHIIRDDLLHPFISGNKFRKLKGFLRISHELEIKKWITFGGAWSNHLVATACAGVINGIQTRGIVRGEKVKNPILFLCEQWGMELEFVSRSEYQILTQEIYTQHKIQENALWIPEGGADPLAFEGCTEIISKIPLDAHYVFTPVGTATTLAGLCQIPHSVKIVGVYVLKANNIFDKYQNQVANTPILLKDGHLGGYAKTPKDYLAFLTLFSQHTGILLDPIYTGKMVYAVKNLIHQSFFNDNEHIYLLHTGGLTGILGKWEEY